MENLEVFEVSIESAGYYPADNQLDIQWILSSGSSGYRYYLVDRNVNFGFQRSKQNLFDKLVVSDRIEASQIVRQLGYLLGCLLGTCAKFLV